MASVIGLEAPDGAYGSLGAWQIVGIVVGCVVASAVAPQLFFYLGIWERI